MQSPIKDHQSTMLSDPTRRSAGAASVLLNGCNLFGVLDDFFLQPIHLRQRLVALGGNGRPLHRVVAVDEVGVERIDLNLQRVGI
jgi:hypothetical protein